MLGACNTWVRLQSRITSSGTTVKSFLFFFIAINFFFFCIKFLFIHLFIYLFIYLFMQLFFTFSPLWLLILFLFFIGLFVVCVCGFKLIFFFIIIPPLCLFYLQFSFHCGWGFRWSEIKISYFGVVYKHLSVGMELVVVKDLFIILYI